MGDEKAGNVDDEPFPWHLGVFDGHCHPTETLSLIREIPNMKAKGLNIMATRGQDQHLVDQVAYGLGLEDLNVLDSDGGDAKQRVIPCFGWHPWFSYQMYLPDDDNARDATPLQGEEKLEHYRAVLVPKGRADDQFFSTLQNPLPFSHFLSQTRQYLEKHPYALVGEVGLDKSFRLPLVWNPEELENRDQGLTPGGREGRHLSPFHVSMEHQKRLLREQLRLAGEMNRAVSMHVVNCQGVAFELLNEIWEGHRRKVPSQKERKKQQNKKAQNTTEENSEPSTNSEVVSNDTTTSQHDEPKPFPPRLCLHSYTSDTSFIRQYLHPSIPTDIYFSFSTAINYSEVRGAYVTDLDDIVKSVPDDRLITESDLHTAGERMDSYLEDIVRKISRVKGWTLEDGVRQLGRNWRRFVFGTEERA